MRAIAAELWDKPNPRFFTRGNQNDALAALGVVRRFEVVGGQKGVSRPVMGYAMRDGDVPYFFVCNTSTNAVRKTLAFRAAGRRPEFWNAEKGTIREAADWTEKEGRTFIEYSFEPLESVFVVFRNSGRPSGQKPREDELVCAVKVEGDWDVSFQPGRGAPGWKVHFDGLQPLNEFANPGVRYFSGTATYEKEFAAAMGVGKPCTDGVTRNDFIRKGRRFVLNLGAVGVIAEVDVKGKKCGTAWHAPYRVDITGALVESHRNKITVKVTNTWHNRLVGDEQEPDDCEWGRANPGTSQATVGRPIRLIPEFVMKNTPMPSKGRVGFCTWNYFGMNSALEPAGLIGPVTIEVYR